MSMHSMWTLEVTHLNGMQSLLLIIPVAVFLLGHQKNVYCEKGEVKHLCGWTVCVGTLSTIKTSHCRYKITFR